MSSISHFGAIIIGDEILSCNRQDAHLSQVIAILKACGLSLAWAEYLCDAPEHITAALKRSMVTNNVVFSFGGIGATPDDHTRQSAAAAGLPLKRHAGGWEPVGFNQENRMIEFRSQSKMWRGVSP